MHRRPDISDPQIVGLDAQMLQVLDSTSDGGFFSAYTNTANTILGAGTLAVPIAMSSAGLLSYLLITAAVILIISVTVPRPNSDMSRC